MTRTTGDRLSPARRQTSRRLEQILEEVQRLEADFDGRGLEEVLGALDAIRSDVVAVGLILLHEELLNGLVGRGWTTDEPARLIDLLDRLKG